MEQPTTYRTDPHVGDVDDSDLENLVYSLTTYTSSVDQYADAVSTGEWDCWRAGFDAPGDDVPPDPYGS